MRDFNGKVAVITGGASGIGFAMAQRFAREGMKIVLADVEKGALDTAVEKLRQDGASAMGVVTDVTRYESVESLERAVIDEHGSVHVLCNNAGVGAQEDAPVWALPMSDWNWTFSVNVYGVIHGLRAFVPGMIERGEEGHIVNTSSGNGGLTLVPTTPIYSASKAAVSSLTESLHLQLVMNQSKLKAHVLYPGPHIVTSNIFTAWRNRGKEFEREIPQAGPRIDLEGIRKMAAAVGRTLETTTPEEVAESAFAGVQSGRYYILPMSEAMEGRIKARTEGILEGRDPQAVF